MKDEGEKGSGQLRVPLRVVMKREFLPQMMKMFVVFVVPPLGGAGARSPAKAGTTNKRIFGVV